jgi:hypothetical protein
MLFIASSRAIDACVSLTRAFVVYTSCVQEYCILVQYKMPFPKPCLAELAAVDTGAARVDRLADIDAGLAARVAGWGA